MTGLASTSIAAAYEAACLAELEAPKPGNVHVFADGHRMSVADFSLSAAVSAPHVAQAGASVGTRVRNAVTATIAAIGQNTNLGIVLLCAPLAAAAEQGGDLRKSLGTVLGALDRQDAADVFAAIRFANPAGLGRARRFDVAEPPQVDLGTAMAEAAETDRIARAYATGFADLFEVGLPALQEARARGLAPPWTTSAVHLAYLAAFPDTHIARKHGPAAAEAVRAEAARRFPHGALAPEHRSDLLAYDAELKAAGLNPGTSADLTVATVFVDLITVQTT